jgi:hypothetical protein
VDVTKAKKEMVWLQGFLDELGKKNENNILRSDSQSAIFFLRRTRCIIQEQKNTIKVSLIQSVLESGQLLLEKIRGTKNSADMLTK